MDCHRALVALARDGKLTTFDASMADLLGDVDEAGWLHEDLQDCSIRKPGFSPDGGGIAHWDMAVRGLDGKIYAARLVGGSDSHGHPACLQQAVVDDCEDLVKALIRLSLASDGFAQEFSSPSSVAQEYERSLHLDLVSSMSPLAPSHVCRAAVRL
eukprot:760492-Hanusia_phi.AAC.1